MKRTSTKSYQELYQQLTNEEVQILEEAQGKLYYIYERDTTGLVSFHREVLKSCYRKWCEERSLPSLVCWVHYPTKYTSSTYASALLDMSTSRKSLTYEGQRKIYDYVNSVEERYRFDRCGPINCGGSLSLENLDKKLHTLYQIAVEHCM